MRIVTIVVGIRPGTPIGRNSSGLSVGEGNRVSRPRATDSIATQKTATVDAANYSSEQF